MHGDMIVAISKKLFFVLDRGEDYPANIYTCDKDIKQLLDLLANTGFIALLLVDESSGWNCYGMP